MAAAAADAITLLAQLALNRDRHCAWDEQCLEYAGCHNKFSTKYSINPAKFKD
jgi:hypothetical protein